MHPLRFVLAILQLLTLVGAMPTFGGCHFVSKACLWVDLVAFVWGWGLGWRLVTMWGVCDGCMGGRVTRHGIIAWYLHCALA